MDPASNNNNNFETNFGLDIFTNLLNSDGTTDGNDKNLIISPFLVEALLALLYLGSDGKTAEELKAKLQIQRFPNNAKMASYFAGNLAAITQNSPDTQLEICSKIFVDEQHDLDMEFQKIAYKYFLTQTEKQNLQHTKNIEDLLKNCLQENLKKSAINFEISQENCKALLLMAANFRNKWFLPFSAYRSGLYDFHVSSDCVKSIPMMLDNEMFVKFVELKEMDARAIELPYEHDDEISMLIILPNKRDGLAELETKLKQVNLSTIAEQMQMESVQLLLPKFQIDFECSLKAVLEKLGFSLLFGEDSNFKNLLSPQSASSSLPIADILHKVCLDVNESGSESSNVEATKPIVISNSIDTRQKFFRADHPFFFAIRNRDATYFMGHVVKF